MKTKVVITGGGTAGHTNPGIAVGQALVEIGLDPDEIHFIGAKRGNEGRLVPEAGFKISLLSGRGIKRKISIQSLTAAISLLFGAFHGFWLIAKLRPKVVMCLGGYASFPASLASVLLFRPIVVSEQNARSSAVNQLFGRFAKVCALPFPNTDLPKGKLTGNPVRGSIGTPNKKLRVAARKKFGFGDNQIVVAVWSGSLGADSVNNAIADLAKSWADRDDVYIYHIVGKRNWENYKGTDQSINNYLVKPYEDNMPELLQACDVAVCRSGASTIGELAIAGLPSVLIPLPGAPRDHQTANTEELVEAGGAVLVPDSDLNSQSLEKALDSFLLDDQKRKKMSEAALSVARPAAAYDVAKLLIEVGDIDV